MTYLEEYRQLLAEIDIWFNHCQQTHPEAVACSKGCSECCRGLFDITILDALLLKTGFDQLPGKSRDRINRKVQKRLNWIRSIWPEFAPPFTINHRPEQEIEALMAADNDSPCVLLDTKGVCLLYNYRPMTCRLHGLPLLDFSGEILEKEWCTKNFTNCDPLLFENIRGDFNRLFRQEAAMGGHFTARLLGSAHHELDTFIPTALFI